MFLHSQTIITACGNTNLGSGIQPHDNYTYITSGQSTAGHRANMVRSHLNFPLCFSVANLAPSVNPMGLFWLEPFGQGPQFCRFPAFLMQI